MKSNEKGECRMSLCGTPLLEVYLTAHVSLCYIFVDHMLQSSTLVAKFS